jgi:hypothetical protein
MRMRIMSCWLVAVVGTAALSLGAPAEAQDTAFQIVSAESQKCLHLRTPDTPGGGGLDIKPCQSSADFAFSLTPSTTEVTQIIVKVTTSRFVCVVATDEPMAGVSKPMPVTTVDCGGLGSLWFQSGPLAQRVIRKADRNQMPAGCLQVSPTTGAVGIDLCQDLPHQQWILKPVP